MTPALFALAFLAAPQCLVSAPRAHHLVRLALAEEDRRALPRGLLVAVVLAESGGRNAIRHGRGACDVGPGQVRARPCTASRIKSLRIARRNLREAGRILARSRAVCTSRPWALGCLQCIWGRYNPRSSTWCPKVITIQRRLIRYVQDRRSAG